MSKINMFMGGALLLLASGTLLKAEIAIDDFSAGSDWHLGRDASVYGLDPLDYPTWVPVPVPGSVTVTDTDPLTILGGRRDITMTKDAGSSHSPTVDCYAAGGAITFNSSWDQGFAWWSLGYGNGGDLNADFTSCGNDRIRLSMFGQIDVDNSGDANGVFGLDSTPCTLTITSNGVTESVQIDLFSEGSIGSWGEPDYYPGGGDITWDFPFSSFSQIDFTDVDQLVITFDYFTQNHAVDYGIRGLSLPGACNGDVVEADPLPVGFSLEQNHPNPFNPGTTIEFSLAGIGYARLNVFNMGGQKVATLAEGLHESGSHQAFFDASQLTSGVYFYTLEVNGHVATRKMVLLK